MQRPWWQRGNIREIGQWFWSGNLKFRLPVTLHFLLPNLLQADSDIVTCSESGIGLLSDEIVFSPDMIFTADWVVSIKCHPLVLLQKFLLRYTNKNI